MNEPNRTPHAFGAAPPHQQIQNETLRTGQHNHTKPTNRVPERGLTPAAIRAARGARLEEPTAAANHTRRPRTSITHRINLRLMCVLPLPVPAPLPHIPMHVTLGWSLIDGRYLRSIN